MTENRTTAKSMRVLILVKETYLEQVVAAKDDHQLQEINRKAPGLELVAESHAQHVETLNAVKSYLEADGMTVEVANRTTPNLKELLANCDIVITVGGDGTFLTASHDIRTGTPVLGVNSAPLTSFGHFCLTDRVNFAATWSAVKSGELKPYPLLRLKLTVTSRELGTVVIDTPVLNEILVAHSHPAGTSHYRLTVGDQSEEHKCSGLLVATPSGSTGFIRSEGGTVLPICDRSFAFLERAPFLRLGEEPLLRQGVAAVGTKLELVSEMKDGFIYIDGNHIQYPFPRGATLTIEAAAEDLMAYIDPEIHAPFIAAASTTKNFSLWEWLGQYLRHVHHP